MKTRYLLLAACAAALAACGPKVESDFVGKRADALDASAWESSQWISAVDAPVLKGPREPTVCVCVLGGD